ncbi:MAG: MBOAT family protein [Verrucomicrobiota bacterium]|nr:MBOAT family protein [Verrucomicrobiota bacterium]
MLFVEFRFFWFFAIVFAVYWSLRENRSRKVWLLVCSYVFYAAWNWKFLFLLMGSSALDYVVGVMLARTETPRARRAWLILSLSANLGTIAVFKYCNFFIGSAAALLAWLGLPTSLHTLNIIIPVGVSFYTFHSMSYTIDVYRGRMRAVQSLLDVACFIGFFPQMVAGPIVRAALFLPQLQSARKFENVDVRGALVLFLGGFVKKACIADAVAPISDRYFAAPEHFTAASAWVGVLCYTVQIYCDFSGYTDMAIACARLLGYELTINFNFPYFARNISDFWHRWHISLSTWLRDYLYIPLGGNREPRPFVYRNIMITMILGGLWHGGAWTFVLWGTLHGLALVVHREWTRVRGNVPRLAELARRLSWPLTMYWVCVAWIFFRAIDLKRALVICNGFILFRNAGAEQIGAWMFAVIGVLGVVHWLNARGTFSRWWRRGPAPLFAAGYGCTAALVLLFIPPRYAPFIYFQF